MSFYAKSNLLLLLAVLSLGACSRKPIQSSGTLPQAYYQGIGPAEIPEHSNADANSKVSIDQLKAWNRKANKPTIGLIHGFYQLPYSKPAGAVYLEQGRVFGASYQSFWLENTNEQPYAVLPASIEQAQVFEKFTDEMLDAGVRLVEVKMADANKIMTAEKKALESNSKWFMGRVVPSGVKLLLSLEKGQGLYGPAYVGRVIQTNDGRLLAMATGVDAGPLSLEPLLRKLVTDALRRLANG